MSAVAERPMVAPERSLVQRFEALERANAVRGYRKDLKADVKRGRKPATAFFAPVPELETMKVFDVLIAIPKVGRVKANKVLNRCRISPSKTVGGLSERQRREMLALLPFPR